MGLFILEEKSILMYNLPKLNRSEIVELNRNHTGIGFPSCSTCKTLTDRTADILT